MTIILHAPDYPRLVETIGPIDSVKHVMMVQRGMSRRDFLAASRIPPWVARRQRAAA